MNNEQIAAQHTPGDFWDEPYDDDPDWWRDAIAKAEGSAA